MNKLYLYALIPMEELDSKLLPDLNGFDEKHKIYCIPLHDIAAVVSDLEDEEFTEEKIKEKINNDMPWLKDRAYHHHHVLSKLNDKYTTIPLKFCTIYNHPDSLKQAIEPKREKVQESFQVVKGNEEWNVKIYCSEDRVRDRISEGSIIVQEKKKEIESLSPGKQFFEKKKIDQLIQEEMEKDQDSQGEKIHQMLCSYAVQADIKENLGKDVTGLEENMSWNSVYLVSKDKVELFLGAIRQVEEELANAGYRIDATGPWPVYHFLTFA